MNSTPLISVGAFDLSIPTPLTNEIPHLSIYNILNKHLRNVWSRDFVGRSNTGYTHTFESQKLVNGEQSKVYTAKTSIFTDPVTGNVYSADFEKINFSIDGALETEIDYLMHEQARYLSKLYPDDFNTLYTLTEAERQSYINEAAHMIHSYFDTEQIVSVGLEGIDKSAADLYFRVKFLTGITPVRSLTGIAEQEEQLLNLLNTGNTVTYSGFSIFSSPNQEYVISNTKTYQSNIKTISLDAFYFLNEQTYKKRAVVKLHGKTRTDSLEDLLRNVSTFVNATPETLQQSVKEFTVLKTEDPLEVLDDIIFGKGVHANNFSLNDLFFKATRENWIKAGATLESLQETVFGDSVLDWTSTERVYPLLSQEDGARELAFFDKETTKVINPIYLENRLITNAQTTLKTFEKSYLIKLGNSQYKNSVLLALGNILYSDLTYRYNLFEDLQLIVDTVAASKDLVLTVDVKTTDDKRIFSGLFDSSFLKEQNLSRIVSNYTFKTFEDRYHADSIFSKKSLQTRLQELVFAIRSDLVITYKTAKLMDESYKDNVVYIEDKIGNKDYSILLTKHPDNTYSILLNYQEMAGENLTVKGISGNTSNGNLVDAADIAVHLGSFSYENSELTINIEDVGSATFNIDKCYNEQNIFAYNENGDVVGQYVTGSTIDKDTLTVREPFIDIDLIPKIVETTKIQKLFGNLINTKFEKTFHTQHEEAFIDSESNIYSNIQEIPIEYFETFEEALQNNAVMYTNVVYDDKSLAEVYVYCTAYKIENTRYAIPSSPLDKISIAKILFTDKIPEFFELKTCKCEIYASNLLRLTDDIRKDIDHFGRVNCLLLNTYGKFYATRAVKALLKNEYCYVTLEDDIENYDTLVEKEAILILDLKQKADVKVDEVVESKRRGYANTQTFKFKQGLKYYRSIDWEDLLRQHLVFDFSNIFSKGATTVYADDSRVSAATVIPASLSYLENLTVLDSQVTPDLFREVLEENRSLYLDSSVKLLTNVALENKMLVYTSDYDCISYLYSTTLPSSITLYDYSNYDDYEPLKEFLEELGREPIDLEDIQKQISRRLVIWGNVIWDANVNKSVKTLRTIWSGYFTNFKIINTDDVLPPEPIVLSDLGITAEQKQKHINICNYNYSENKGDAITDWILSTVINTSKTERTKVNVCDAFSHEELEDKTSDISISAGRDIFLDSFALKANRMDYSISEDSTVLKTCDAYVSKLAVDTDLEIRSLDDSNKVRIDYDTYDHVYTFTTSQRAIEYSDYKADSRYSMKLVYNMLHLDEENFEALGYFNSFISSTALQLFLEHCVYIYYVNHCTNVPDPLTDNDEIREKILKINPTLQDDVIIFYRKLLFDGTAELPDWQTGKKIINLKDVLDFAYELYLSVNCIPCIGNLNKNGKLDLYYYIMGREAGKYYIYEGTSREVANGDLLGTLLARISKSFQTSKSLYKMYLNAIYRYQAILPNKAYGLPSNLSIDTCMEVSPISEEIRISSKVTDPAVLSSKEKFLTDNSEKQVRNVLKNDLLNIFPNLKLTDIELGEDSIKIKDNKYKLTESIKCYKEYYPTTVQLFTEKEKDSSTDIDRCIMQFDQDFGLKKKGYLYLTDAKAPNKRTSYSSSRETQILDRSCALQNLHIIGYKETDKQLKLLLQDSSTSYTRFVENAMQLIKPLTASANSQEISDNKISLGFKWTDPGLEIGYTFYKRKFIFEGEISSSNTSVINLVDENLKAVKSEEENFSFTDHVASGDLVQIIFNTSTSKYKAGQKVTLDLSSSEYHGPYKVIYSRSITMAEGPVQYVVLSGLGNLIVVTIPLGGSGSSINVSSEYVFDATHTQNAYLLSSGDIVYCDAATGTTYKVAKLPEFENSNLELILETEPVSMTFTASANVGPDNIEEENGICTIRLTTKASGDKLLEDALTTKHDEWYIFGETPASSPANSENAFPGSDLDTSTSELKQLISKSVPTQVLASIPLNDGFLDIDNFDRMFFESDILDDTTETTWLSLPDKAEEFDTSVQTNCYEKETAEGREIIDIETADGTTLISLIREALTDMFSASTTMNEFIDTEALANYEDTASILNAIAQSKKGSFELYHGSTSDMISSVVASVLSHIKADSEDKNWAPATGTVYMPELKEIDVPVYFKAGEKPKWKKVYAIVGETDTTLETAGIDELKKFAKALLPSRSVSRNMPNITSYSKVKDNVVLWDQDTTTLTVTDSNGLLKKRIALNSLAIEHPLLTDRLVLDKNKVSRAFSNSNLLFTCTTSQDLYNYWNSMNSAFPIAIGTEAYNIYSLFGLTMSSDGTISYNEDAPLYLPRVLADYLIYDWDSIPALGTNQLAIQKLLDVATNVEKYKKWIENCLHVDFMTTTLSKFVAFKDSTYDLNLPLLANICNAIVSLNPVYDIIQQVLEFTAKPLDSTIAKGLPYFTVDTANQETLMASRLTAVPTNNFGTKAFESLVASSGIEVSENYVVVYGTINWPNLEDIKTRVTSLVSSNYTGSLQATSPEIVSSISEEIAGLIEAQIISNYAKFNGSREYTAGESSFKVSVDLSTGRICETQLDIPLKNEQAKILSIFESNGSKKILTTDGAFELNDEESKALVVDPTDATIFAGEQPLENNTAASVFDALKSTKMFNSISVNVDKTLDIVTNGTSVKNAETIYSSVAYVTDKELGIITDSIALDEGTTVTATVLVTNRTKDNFQLGYGTVTNLDKLPLGNTLFEVPSAYNADFATYDNRTSIRTFNTEMGSYSKPSVYDLYPSFEKVSESERSKFYKLDEDSNPKFLKNGVGRYIFRVTDPSLATGGRLIGNIKAQDFADITSASNTIANEWVDFTFTKAAAEKGRLNEILLPEKRTFGKNYETIVGMYSVQKVPELVDDPWFAVLNHPYKLAEASTSVVNGLAELKDGYLELTFNSSEAVNFADFINAIKPELQVDTRTAEANIKQVAAIEDIENFTSLDINAEVVNVELKILNQTETLPRLVPITKIVSSLDTSENLVLKTDSHELYIPEKGYGQALLGNYTIPQDCQFEEGLFFDNNLKTLNSNGEQFILVDRNGKPILDTDNNIVVIPKLAHKSFAQANIALPIDLATKESLQIQDSLIDLSNFDIGYNSISCNQMYLLELLDFTGRSGGASELVNEKSLSIYEVFKSRIKFSCKLLYSELPKDASTDNVICLSTWISKNYTNTRLVEALGYTRAYTGLQIPANTRYLSRTGNYRLTNTLLARNLNAYSADENGNLVYLDIDGKPITKPTINKEPVCAVRRSQNVALFTVTNGTIQALVANCFYYTKSHILPKDANSMLFVKASDGGLGSILAICNPNEAPAAYSNIQNITNAVDRWNTDTSFKFVFDEDKVKDLQVELIYEKSHKNVKFNMVYLKDINGEVVAKVFFRRPVDADSLLIFQKNL